MARELQIDQIPLALKRYANDYKKGQVTALNNVAFEAREAAVRELTQDFILRNTWSKRSMQYEKASDVKLEVTLFLRDRYLAEQDQGGKRDPKQGGTPIPAKGLAEAGVDPKKVIAKAKRAKVLIEKHPTLANVKGGAFAARIGQVLGVWARTTEARYPLKLLYVLQTSAKTIKKRQWYDRNINEVYNKRIIPELNEQIDKAIKKYADEFI